MPQPTTQSERADVRSTSLPRQHPNVRRVLQSPVILKVDPSGVGVIAVQCFESSALA